MASPQEDRKKLLLELYNQLWNSINVRLNLIWESIGIIVGAFAVYALTEKNIIGLDYATTLIVLLAFWFLLHIVDMTFWYNRNLVMIANIEKQFLNVEDAKLLYPYFLFHRKGNPPVSYLAIQAVLGLGIAAIVLVLHFLQVILPRLCSRPITLTLSATLPYAMLVVAIVVLAFWKQKRDSDYANLVHRSPGKDLSNEASQEELGEFIQD